MRASFLGSGRTYGARRVWKDLAAEGVFSGLHRIERLMRLQAFKARPRRRRLPLDLGERQASAVAPNVLDRAEICLKTVSLLQQLRWLRRNDSQGIAGRKCHEGSASA